LKAQEKKTRRKIARIMAELEFLDRKLTLEYGRLLIGELKIDRKMRNRALRLAKKRKVGYIQ